MIEKLPSFAHVEIADSAEVAAEQTEFSRRWAKLYRNGEYSGDAAVMLLQNPVDYLSGGYVEELPNNLQENWKDLLESTTLAMVGVSTEHNAVIAQDYRKSLSEALEMARSDDLDPEQREVVRLLMGLSSKLFAMSIIAVPGDVEKYTKQLAKMRDWQEREQADYSITVD